MFFHPKNTCFVRLESSSPVKLTKFQVKRNTNNKEDEIFINKRSRLEDPSDPEIDFNFKVTTKATESQIAPGITDIVSLSDGSSTSLVNLSGRISFHGFEETIQKNGNTLQKQEAVFTNNTVSIRMVPWESDIAKVTSGSHYTLSRAVVREYDGDKYVTLNRRSIIIKEAAATVDREDQVNLQRNLKSVECPAEGVDAIKRFLLCNRCQM